MQSRAFWVYILTNEGCTVLYTGVTNSLRRRIWQHRTRKHDGFTSRYNVDRLIYFERYDDPLSAIAREKEIKGWRRAKKVALIARLNPEWSDLSAGWYERDPSLRSG